MRRKCNLQLAFCYMVGPLTPGVGAGGRGGHPASSPPTRPLLEAAKEGSSPPVATSQAQLICFKTFTTNTNPESQGPLSPSSQG